MKVEPLAGPYVVEDVNGPYPHDVCLGYDVPGQGSPILIAHVFHDEDNEALMPIEVANAIARLFAASPDMRAALIRLLDECPFWCDIHSCECGNGTGFDVDGNPCEHIQARRALDKVQRVV